MSAPNRIGPRPKAYWIPLHHQLFVELCMEQIQKGNRPTHCFKRVGWHAIIKGFTQKTGLHYDKKQMKNHYDSTKELWKAWKALIGKSGMRFDPVLRTISASDDAWLAYIQANPKAAQFRSRPLEFEDELDVIFGGTTATKDNAWASSSRALLNDTVNVTQSSQDPFSTQIETSNSYPQTPEETLEFPNVCNHVEVGEDDIRRSSFSKKRSLDSTPPSSRNSKRNTKEVFAKMADQIDRLIEVVLIRQLGNKESTSSTPTYTIIDCIQCLDSIDKVDVGSELYFYAVDLFLKEDYRMTFMGLRRPGMRLKWLQRMYALEHPSE